MGVIYKLKEEVVQFIISQRQGNPLFSCRQLAESASQKFGLHLSKSSVHDVLKESGFMTPRGRKPKDKFKIPQEKKQQIQSSLSQVKLLPAPTERPNEVIECRSIRPLPQNDEGLKDIEISTEYEGAGRIFLKAIFWDLGIFSQEQNIKESDWDYYRTYSKGIKVVLENNTHFFIDLPVPIERCIREAVDGLINNINPLIVHHVSDEMLFKACMEAQAGFKISTLSIVDQNDHILLELGDIMEFKRDYLSNKRIFVESNEKNTMERLKAIFFPQILDINSVADNLSMIKGFDATSKGENTVSLLINGSYNNKSVLQEAAEKLNGMYLRDEQNRLVKVKILSA
jgi:hypothetical protein